MKSRVHSLLPFAFVYYFNCDFVRKRGGRILLLVIGLGFRVSFGVRFSSIVINCSRD